jgi:cytosine/adenosine deaminase-related metal-dependent hydrolase
MATIDAAQALGLQDHLGSLEPGKKADIVLIDMRKPHLYPPTMPVTKIAHFVNAADVDTVIVDGKLLMQARRLAHLDESAILDEAAAEAKLAFDRAALSHLLVEPRDYWSVSKRLDIETKG